MYDRQSDQKNSAYLERYILQPLSREGLQLLYLLIYQVLAALLSMIFVIAQALLLYGVSWLLWKIIQRQFFASTLDNIPGPSGASFWTGSLKDIYNLNGWAYHKDITAKFGSVFKFRAFLGETQLVVFDPKALHTMFIKDQNIFEETPMFISVNKLAFGPGLIGTLGDQHRKQRKMLNPVFSIAHMRNMVPIFYEVCHKLRDAIDERVKDGPREIEMMSWVTRTALELIGQTGLGYSFDSLTEDTVKHPYSVAVKRYITYLFKLRFWAHYFLPTLSKVGPAKFRRQAVNILGIFWPNFREMTSIVDVINDTSVEILEEKKKALAAGDEALANQIGQGKDIMSILMRANMTASKEESLSDDELLGQMSTLIFAAMDTTSSALARLLYLLAKHPDVQVKLRKEIMDAKELNGGENLPYDELVALPYLDAICRETMRIYTPATKVQRIAHQDAVLPLHTPVKGLDGQEITEIAVPKNTEIIVDILASNTNPDLWGPDAHEWKPERWLSPLPGSLIDAHLPGIYSHLMTFIGGGRACIGFKFSQLEMKIVISLLIESFRFAPSKQEVVWQMAGLTVPTVKGTDGKSPALPVVVERIA